MKAPSTIAFGAAALLFATFANATPAAAADVGFTIQIGHDRYDDYGYDRRHRACWNRWYRRHHPFECYGGLRHRTHYGFRGRRHDDYWYWHRRHHRHCRDRRPFHDHW